MKRQSLFFLLFLSISLLGCCETVQVEYDETETYIENESYIEGEDVSETLTYERVGNTISWKRRSGALLFNTLPQISATIIIKNTSQHDGDFSLNAIINSDDGRVSVFGKRHIAAGQTAELSASSEVGHDTYKYNIDIESFEIIAPEITYTKSVTKTREVPKERLVTKQRDCKTCEEDCDQFRKL